MKVSKKLRERETEARPNLGDYQEQLVAQGMKAAREGRFVDSVEMRRRLTRLKRKARSR